MGCERTGDQLVDYLYGELDRPAREAFERHLAGCPACAREVEQLGGVLRLVRSHPVEGPAAEVSQRILQAARAAVDHQAARRAARARPWWGWLAHPAAAAAALALVVVGIGLAIHEPSGPALAPATAPSTAADAAGAIAPAARPESEALADASPPQPPLEAKPAARLAADRLAPQKAARPKAAPAPEADPALRSRARPAAPEAGALGEAAAGGSRWDRDERLAPGGGLARGAARPERSSPRPAPAGPPEQSRLRFAEPPPEPAPPALAAPVAGGEPAEEVEAQAGRDLDGVGPVRGGAPTAAAPLDEVERRAEKRAAARSRGPAPDALQAEPADDEGSSGPATRPGPAVGPDLFERGARALAGKDPLAAARALRAFLSAAPADPRAVEARYLLALALFRAGRCPEAIRAVDEAVGAAPGHPRAAEALFDQASCLVRQGDFAAAGRIYDRIERDHPARAAEARRERGRLAPPAAEPRRP